MRKLTAGIFFVLWGLVSVGGANAAVVSTEYLDEVLDGVQTKMTANGPVKIVDNVISVDTGAVSETGTNLVTAADINTAINSVVGTAKTELQASVNLKADKTALEATDVKVTANETAIATEKSAREAADAQLQTNINLKANIADVYSKNDADAKFEAQAAATAKLQEAKNYTDEQLKTLTEDMWGGGEGSEDQGLQGVVASQALKITALEDKVGDMSVVARIAELDSADTAVDKEFVTAVSEKDGVITVLRRALAAEDIPTVSIEKVDGLQDALNARQVKLTNTDGAIVISQDGVISIAAQGITSTMIKDDAIVEAKLAADSVTSTKIKDGAVTAGKIAADAVSEATIVDGAVTANKIGAGAITNEKLGAQAVKGTNIENNAVGAQQLAADVNSLLTGAIQAPTSENAEGTFVLTAKKITGTDGNVTYSYAWEDIAGRDE